MLRAAGAARAGAPACGAGLAELCSRLYMASIPCVFVLALATTLGMFMIFWTIAFVVNVRGTLPNLPAFRTSRRIRWTLHHTPKLVLVTLYNIRREVVLSMLICFGLVLVVGFSLLLGLFGKESPSSDVLAAALVAGVIATLLALLGRWAFDRRTRWAHTVPRLARMKTGLMFETAAHSYSRQATLIGMEMYNRGFITKEDVDAMTPKLLLCIPSVVIFRSLVRSARPECRGLVLSDGKSEVTYFEEEKSILLLDDFFKQRDEVRSLSLSEEEQSLITQKLMGRDVSIAEEQRTRMERIKLVIEKITSMVLIGNAVDTWREWTNTWVTDLQRQAQKPVMNPNMLRVKNADGAMLMTVAKEGMLQDIKQLLDNKADVDRPSPRYKRTPLIAAVENGHECAVAELLKGHAKVNLECEGQITALHLATFGGSPAIVGSLLHFKADVECKDVFQRRPLHLAAEAGHMEVARLLIANKASPNPVEDHDATPLMIAAANGKVDLVRLLFQSGGELEGMDCRGWAPLMYAVNFAMLDCITCLLEARASPELRRDGHGTALHLAAHRGVTEAIKLLLQSRADPQVQDQGFTPLDMAMFMGNEDAVAMLAVVTPPPDPSRG